ncbi:MAG: GNAT family N-acetyltransferase [Candidatus Brocadiaceae bacterium]
MYTFREVADYIRARGLRPLLATAVRRFLFCHERRLLLCLSLDELTPLPDRTGDLLRNVEVREARTDDLQPLHRAMRQADWWERKRELRRWAETDCYHLVVAEADGRLIGSACVGRRIPRSHGIARRAVALEPGDAYGVHVFVAPRWRGRGVYPLMLSDLVRRLKEDGRERILTLVDPHNRAAVRSHLKMGMTEAEEVVFRRLLVVARASCRPLPRE